MPMMNRYEPKPVHGFTVEELENLRRIIDRCWNTIADDVFINDMGVRDESMTFSRYDMAEISLDADRWRHAGAEEGDGAIIDKLQKTGWRSDKWNDVIKQALPYAEYCY